MIQTETQTVLQLGSEGKGYFCCCFCFFVFWFYEKGKGRKRKVFPLVLISEGRNFYRYKKLSYALAIQGGAVSKESL